MKVKWLGHSAFVVISDKGTKIVFDPFEAGSYGGALGYPPINETADLLLMSHTTHPDHSYSKAVGGNPQTITSAGEQSFKDIKISGVSTFHDATGGSERGENIVFTIDIDDVRLSHLGDLGHILTDEQVEKIGKTNVILIPVGGFYTIDAKQATAIANKLNPNILIPMHYKTDLCGFPIAPVGDFLKGKEPVERLGQEVAIIRASLPSKTEIWVLDYPRP